MKLCADCHGEKGALESERNRYCPECRKERRRQRKRMEQRKSLVRKAAVRDTAAKRRREAEEERNAADQRAIEAYREQREYEKARGMSGDPGRSLSREEINRLVAENKITDPSCIRDILLVERTYA